jgi:putative phosphoesterase
MNIGIVSDTHDNREVVEAAADLFEGRVDTVVHCGDVVAPFSVTPFDRDYDFYAVRGNNDGEWMLRDAVRSFGAFLGEFGELSLGGESFGVYHGTSRPIVDALVCCGDYDYVLHGHSHQRAHEQTDGTVRINPGGVSTGPGDDEPPAGVVLDTDTGDVIFHDLR